MNNYPDLITRQNRACKALIWFCLLLYFGSASILICMVIYFDDWQSFSKDRIMIASGVMNIMTTMYIAYKCYHGLSSIHKN